MDRSTKKPSGPDASDVRKTRGKNGKSAERGPIRTSKPKQIRKQKLRFEWTRTISDDQWRIYGSAIRAMRQAGLRFLLGGGFALAIYAGRWRDTKDIDFYILQSDREAAIDALTRAGFKDYFDTQPYDRRWIYRSTRDGVIVDIIWAMANQRAQVDRHWFEGAASVSIRNEPLEVIPMEEFAWCKLYIIQRDHCDWTDVMNLFYAAGPQMDWDYLLWRLERDWPLLKAVLSVYGWMCPRRALELPESLRRRLGVEEPDPQRRGRFDRVRLLDSRNWFAAALGPDDPLQV